MFKQFLHVSLVVIGLATTALVVHNVVTKKNDVDETETEADDETEDKAENSSIMSVVIKGGKKIVKKASEKFAAMEDTLERVVDCVKNIVSDANKRRVAGVIILGTGIGLGGGLIASSYVE